MLNRSRIALIEDDEIMGASLLQRLELEGAEVIWLRQVGRALGALRTPRAPIDAVVCDIRLPDGSGEELFNRLHATATPPPFLFITGHGGVEQAVRLMRSGAADYITKPFDIQVFLERLSMLVSTARRVDMPPLLGISPAARKIERLVQKAAQGGSQVLIRGGPGTGKGLVARRIHELSDRRAAPFVAVNLARVADTEAALFADGGALERTGEGVLFIQALSRLSGTAQERLLRALEAGVEGRIIGACGFDLQALADRRAFNPDLYYHLRANEISIPPLAARSEDALWLMQTLFEQLNATRTRPLKGISALAEEAVREHDWPGGGRELRARVVAAFGSAGGEYLQPADLFPERMAEGAAILTLAQARERAERRQIIEALELTGGQIGQAAKLLRVSRTTLWQKMQKLGLSGAGP